MDRNEWIDNVVRPWKDGDVTEGRMMDAGTWFVAYDKDPVNFSPELKGHEYRIKPRVVRWEMECPQHIQFYVFEKVAKAMEYCHKYDVEKFSTEFIDAIRNAKPLQEGSDG